MSGTARIRLELGEHSHDVHVGRGASQSAGALVAKLARGRPVVALADLHVDALHGEALARAWADAGVRVQRETLPRGESAKTMAVVEATCRRLAQLGVERDDVIAGVGGGAATDAAGFVAAVYLRGVSFVAVPTTLLGMVDAAIGGKTAVDLPEGKNLVGAFRQPRLVVADLAFLETLPEREFRAGFAEMVKIAWIADPELFARFEELDENFRFSPSLVSLVARCIELKARIVARDERESGERALLNFGHTWGHALETEARGALLHGEAVALGMVSATHLSVELGRCSPENLDRLVRLLERAGLPTRSRDVGSARDHGADAGRQKAQGRADSGRVDRGCWAR